MWRPLRDLCSRIENAIHTVCKRNKSAALLQRWREIEPEQNDVAWEGREEAVPIQEVKQQGPLVVRSISGKIQYSDNMAGDNLPLKCVVEGICQNMQAREDEISLSVGDSVLDHSMILGQGDCVAHPGAGKTLEISLTLVAGPPITVHSMSGREIEVLDGVPACGDDCHFDRDYQFTSLGDFAKTEQMRYVMTCNDDRKTPSHVVMWQLDLRETATVYLNFRSAAHVQAGSAHKWLDQGGWKLQSDFKGTVSSGYPNGPYEGPVFAKTFWPQSRKCVVDLMGSNYWEGTYFVFVQLGA